MKKITLAAMAVAILVGAAMLGSAAQPQQESLAGPKTLVTVAFSGYDEILKDIEFLGTLSGNAQLKQMVEGTVQQSPAGPLLAGIDTSRPWGFVLQTDAGQLPMFAFVPTTDLDKMLAALEPFFGKAGDAGGGVKELDAQGKTIYLKQKEGGWVFIAQSPDALAGTPDDPTQLLGGLHKRYDLSVRVSVANVPPMFRQMAMGVIQMGAQSGMQQMPDESDEQYALRTKMTNQGISHLQTMLNELDTLLIGMAIDRTASSAYLDFAMTAIEGTEAAEEMAQNSESPSEFAGFALPGAAFTLNAVSKISPRDVEQAKTSLAPVRANAVKELEKQGLSGAELEQAKGFVGDLFSLLDSMIEGGRIDVGMSVLLDPDALTYVSGFAVGDTAKLDSLIKELADQVINDDPGAADVIKLNADEHQGVQFHVVSLPTAQMAAEAPNLPRMVGDTLDVVIGIGPQNAYVAAGRSALDTLKKAIDQSKDQAGQAVLPMHMVLAATPIAKFVAVVARDETAREVAVRVAEVLEGAGQKDHLVVTSTPVTNGVKIRVEAEEGVLKLLGSAPAMAGPGM